MRTLAIIGMLAVGLLALAPGANAHLDAVHLNVEAREDGCAGAREFCFELTSGNLDDIGPGTQVEVFFRNQGSTGHQFWVTTKANMDPSNHDTSTSNAIAGTQDPVAPGNQQTVTFTIPDDAKGFYFWCDIGQHESRGMWILHDITPADGGNSSALGAPLALLAGLFVVAVMRRR